MTFTFSFSRLRQPTGQRLSNVRMQQTKISIGPILFLYYEESLVSSNLNSKQLRFHGVRPNKSSQVPIPIENCRRDQKTCTNANTNIGTKNSTPFQTFVC